VAGYLDLINEGTSEAYSDYMDKEYADALAIKKPLSFEVKSISLFN